MLLSQNETRRRFSLSTIHAPQRFALVGGFLRPDYLRQARAAFDRGQLSADELKAAEGKLSVENHPSIDHFRFVKAQEDESAVANPLFSTQFDF